MAAADMANIKRKKNVMNMVKTLHVTQQQKNPKKRAAVVVAKLINVGK